MSDEHFSVDVALIEASAGRGQAAKVVSDIAPCRPKFEEIFANAGAPKPTLADFLYNFRQPGRSFNILGMQLFERATKAKLDEAATIAFVNGCPPFEALLVALLTAEYER